MRYLCHAGPWSDSYLSSIVRHIDADNECIVLSAHKSIDQSGVWYEYYSFLKKNKGIDFKPFDNDNDIIKRCRLLRNIPLKSALWHLNSMRDAIRKVFDKEKPDIILSETIDSYIMDLIYFEAKNRNIPFVGLVTVFLNGYFRISARGEYNYIREPDDLEINEALRLLDNREYLPNFVVKDKKNPKYSILRKWIRNIAKIPYFSIKRITSGDYYNYHYWASLIVSFQWFNFFPRFEIGKSNWNSEITNSGKMVVYVPLQMIPEATVDYWCESLDVIDYDNLLLNFIEKHKGLHFLVKEHPNVIGYRNTTLYSKLESMKNVTICPTQINSNELFEYYSAVLIWTGTVGFESALRGKPVLSFSQPYYFSNKGKFKLVDMNLSTNDILEYIELNKNQLTDSDRFEMIKFLLSGLDKGTLIVDGSWQLSSEKDLERMEQLASSLRNFLKSRVFCD